MNKEIKKKWLAKLRDPNTKQGRGTLKDADGCMCVLGVLCEVAVEEGVATSQFIATKEWSDELDKYFFTGKGHYLYSAGKGSRYLSLPPGVLKWAGLINDSPFVNFKHGTNTLSQINDDGATLKEIADLIEEQL